MVQALQGEPRKEREAGRLLATPFTFLTDLARRFAVPFAAFAPFFANEWQLPSRTAGDGQSEPIDAASSKSLRTETGMPSVGAMVRSTQRPGRGHPLSSILSRLTREQISSRTAVRSEPGRLPGLLPPKRADAKFASASSRASTGDAMIMDMRDRASRFTTSQQRTTLTEASPPASDGTL
jgi:hypothetical protein